MKCVWWRCSSFFFFNYLFIIIYLFFWLCWAFVSVRGLSPVAESRGHSSSRRAGLPPWRPLLLRSRDSRRSGSAVVAHGPSCSEACGIFPDQGPNPCPPHWQADSQPLHHQGSPQLIITQWLLTGFADICKFISVFPIAHICVFFEFSPQLVVVTYWFPH